MIRQSLDLAGDSLGFASLTSQTDSETTLALVPPKNILLLILCHWTAPTKTVLALAPGQAELPQPDTSFVATPLQKATVEEDSGGGLFT